jgi:hypothetical protein
MILIFLGFLTQALANSPSLVSMKKMNGSCIVMNLPGASENLFSPCNGAALQLFYRKDNQNVISVIRTSAEGKFEFEVPPTSTWRLVSASSEWKEKVDLIGNHDGTQRVVVILKPDFFLEKPKR